MSGIIVDVEDVREWTLGGVLVSGSRSKVVGGVFSNTTILATPFPQTILSIARLGIKQKGEKGTKVSTRGSSSSRMD